MTNKQRGEEALKKLDRSLKARDRKESTKPVKVAAASLATIAVLAGGIYVATTWEPSQESTQAASTSSTAADTEIAPLALTRENPLPETVTCTYNKTSEPAARQVSLPGTENVSARGTASFTLETNRGPIGLELDRSVSPCTVNNFEHLAKAGYYNDTVCHRITTQGLFVLQCGDPLGAGSGGPGFQFANEYPTDEGKGSSKVIYPRGTIAMANAGEGTNGSQFFLNYQDSPLAGAYTYFGKIDEAGLKTLDAIAAKGTASGAADGKPKDEVRITRVTS